MADRYLSGDVYQWWQGLNNGLIAVDDSSDQQYLRYVKALARQGWPTLLYLVKFMECSTVPYRGRLLRPDERQQRHSRINMTVLDYDPSAGFTQTIVDTRAGLQDVLTPGSWRDENDHLRVIVVEDLSSTMIEALGSHLDVNPSFFGGHVNDYHWYHIRDPWFLVPDLHSSRVSQSYFTLRYFRPQYFPDRSSSDRAKAQTKGFNVLRRIESEMSRSSVDLDGSTVGFTRSTLSFWIRPDNGGSKGWLSTLTLRRLQRQAEIYPGIILVDPAITEGFPLWGGYNNLFAPPSMQSNTLSAIPRPWPESSREEIVRNMESLPKEDLDLLVSAPDHILLVVFRLISASWQLCLGHATTHLSMIEWDVQSDQLRTAKGLDETLQKLHPWRRRIPLYTSGIESALLSLDRLRKREYLIRAVVHGASPTNAYGANWDGLIEDFKQLEDQRASLEARSDKIISVITAIMAIDESKKARQNALDVTRVTYLAFVFIPLSFVASFLGMDTSFPQGESDVYWIFLIISVPITGLSLLIALYFEPLKKLIDFLMSKCLKREAGMTA